MENIFERLDPAKVITNYVVRSKVNLKDPSNSTT